MVFEGAQIYKVGEETFLQSISPVIATHFAVVLEDDGETGYAYAYTIKDGEPTILDALHIYNVEDVADKEKPCQLDFIWSDDGLVAFIGINKYTHVIFDFENQAGYSRNGFPESNGTWAKNSNRELTDEMVDAFYEAKK